MAIVCAGRCRTGVGAQRGRLSRESAHTEWYTPQEARSTKLSATVKEAVGDAEVEVSKEEALRPRDVFFEGHRVRPFVTGSVDVLWTDSANSVTIVSSTAPQSHQFVEQPHLR